MTNKLLTIWCLFLLSSPMFAHHSVAVYDTEHPITLKGTVKGYAFINPHAQIQFEVKDDKGNVEVWVAESGPPQRLHRIGWNQNTLKSGDEITVTGAPAKTGRKFVSVQKLVAPNGQVLGVGAE